MRDPRCEICGHHPGLESDGSDDVYRYDSSSGEVWACGDQRACERRQEVERQERLAMLTRFLVGARVRITEPGRFFGRTGVVCRPPDPKRPQWRLVELTQVNGDAAGEAACPVEALEDFNPDSGANHVH